MSRFLPVFLAVCSTLPLPAARAADDQPVVEIYMPSPCLACIDWGSYLAGHGFRVVYRETADMAEVKRRLKVPAAVASVHTTVVGGYFVEGHAYAEDIQELLRDKPQARGIAVPGLPRGAPGRELSNPTCETGCTCSTTAAASASCGASCSTPCWSSRMVRRASGPGTERRRTVAISRQRRTVRQNAGGPSRGLLHRPAGHAADGRSAG